MAKPSVSTITPKRETFLVSSTRRQRPRVASIYCFSVTQNWDSPGKTSDGVPFIGGNILDLGQDARCKSNRTLFIASSTTAGLSAGSSPPVSGTK